MFRQTFWNVSDNDSNHEDESLEEGEPETHADNEEEDPVEDSDACNYFGEPTDLNGNRRLLSANSSDQTRDFAHHCVVSDGDHNSIATAVHTISREKRQILGFQWVVMIGVNLTQEWV